MKRKRPDSNLIVLLLFSFFTSAFGQLTIKSTPELDLIYFGKVHEFIVPHLERCYYNSHAHESRIFDYSTREKTTLYLHDFGDYGNAGATCSPWNYMMMELAPNNYAFETLPANERMNWTVNHEMVHIITTDQNTGSDHFYRQLFLGKVADSPEDPLSIFYSYLTTPRRLTPRWYLEGIAVFMETWLAGGRGRAQGAYDEMVFRSMVRDQAPFFNVVGLEAEGTAIDFQVGVNSYLYGTRFVSYLGYTYGPDKLLQWYKRTPGSKRYFATQFKQVYGRSLADEWSRWIEWERNWQQANLDSIRQNPVTAFRPLSKRALGSISRGYYDAARNRLITAVNYPGQVAHIASLDLATGTLDKICDVKGPMLYVVTSLAFDPATSSLFYTSDNARWRDLNVVDINTRKSRLLMKDARIGDLAFNRADSSLWGIRHFNGLSTLVRIPHPYTEWQQIYSFPYGQDVFDLDLSPDGKLLCASLVEISGQQKLISMQTAEPDSIALLFDFESSLPESFTFSADGRYLYGSSYYSGVSNIYRYDLLKKDMDILSNDESGLFRPLPISTDSLLVMRYTGQGFVPGMIAINIPEKVSAVTFLGTQLVKKHASVQKWMIGSPRRINLDSLHISTRPYHSLRHMRLTSAYPIVQGYKENAAVGYRANLADLIGIASLELAALYSPDQNLPSSERLHLGLDFRYWQWHLNASLNGTDFYDLFGPTKVSRKGYTVGLEHFRSLIYDKPRTLDLTIGVKHFGGLEKLPDYQNISAPYSQMSSARIALDYQDIRKSLGSVDDEKGVIWQATTSAVHVNGKTHPRLYGRLDLGMPLAIGHSSIWLRSAAGYSYGSRTNPFANFFFGGFGNNWVDNGSEKRYREYYSFPGVALNEIGGKTFGKAMLEWNLPPLRFSQLGFTSFYCRWMRPALFAAAIQTNFGQTEGTPGSGELGVSRSVGSMGAQIDFRLVTLSRFDSTFSLGYALAIERARKTREFMISLKIL